MTVFVTRSSPAGPEGGGRDVGEHRQRDPGGGARRRGRCEGGEDGAGDARLPAVGRGD